MYPPNKVQMAELMRLQKANNGLLAPAAVVNAARPKDSVLHPVFEWDNAVCGERYRLLQASEFIRVAVIILPYSTKPVRIFVSLKENRNSDGGYVSITTVLSSKAKREMFLQEALDDLRILQDKYSILQEMAEVFKAADNVRKKYCRPLQDDASPRESAGGSIRFA